MFRLNFSKCHAYPKNNCKRNNYKCRLIQHDALKKAVKMAKYTALNFHNLAFSV